MCSFFVVSCCVIGGDTAFAATFTVNNTGDAGDASAGNGVCATSGGVCTLRAALQEANALAGTDTINFNIGSGPQTITISGSDLPVISTAVTIDATTQPGSGSGPRILLDGTNTRTLGLDTSSTVTIRGLAIGQFTTAGIRANATADTVTIERCYIGVGFDGITDLGNGDGILVRVGDFGGSALILGNVSGGGNVISGNQDTAVEITDTGSGAKLNNLTLQGNIIGLGADGATEVSNTSGGVRVNIQFGTMTIGGPAAGRNIISGNGGGGFITQGFLQTDTIIFSNNYIGVAQDGITARGNGGAGATLVGKQYTVESNIIAANTGNGLSFSTCNLASPVRGNRIGVGLDGSARGNGGNGIVWSFQNGGVIGGPGSDQNVIANNGGSGVRISSNAQAEIDENSIYNNGGLGIDLGVVNVVDANDAGDPDTGSGNNLQNRPVITSAVRASGLTLVTGSLNSTPSSFFTIRVFASLVADPSGFGEGQTFVGTATLATNALGDGSFSLFSPDPQVGTCISATATSTAGDTSEFSNCSTVQAPTAAAVSIAGQVTDTGGRAISGATVTICDQFGLIRYARTNPFGYYRFEGVRAGQNYVISAQHKVYEFSTQIVPVTDDLISLNFTGHPLQE